jgi:BMFP domain-containing protein YqiC
LKRADIKLQNGTTVTLEKRYIELLEQKIAQLEARLKDAGDVGVHKLVLDFA